MTEISTRDRREDNDDPLSKLYERVHGGYAQSQATVIEQTRAATQVMAQFLIAKQSPRDEVLATQRMREAADQLELADHAFFAFPRAGQNVTGLTVHMARALLALWGNAMADVVELHHDEVARTTEMRAYAVDLETNVTFARTFTVQWRIDTQRGVKTLSTDRDIYENNANLGARRLRECIFDLLPGWYKNQAGDIARKRLQNPDPSKSQAQLAADAIDWLTRHGVNVRRIEARLGKLRGEWDAYDLGQLRVLMGTLNRNEATALDLFPEAGVTSEEIRGAVRPSAASEPDAATQAGSEPSDSGAAKPARTVKHPGRPELDEPS